MAILTKNSKLFKIGTRATLLIGANPSWNMEHKLPIGMQNETQQADYAAGIGILPPRPEGHDEQHRLREKHGGNSIGNVPVPRLHAIGERNVS